MVDSSSASSGEMYAVNHLYEQIIGAFCRIRLKNCDLRGTLFLCKAQLAKFSLLKWYRDTYVSLKITIAFNIDSNYKMSTEIANKL